MTDFERILEDLPKSFDEFYKHVLNLLELENLTDEELAPVREEIEALYSDALLEASEKVFEPEDRDFIEGYLLTHPGTNRLDVYFAAAASKPNIDQVLKDVLKEVLERLQYLKSKIRDAK